MESKFKYLYYATTATTWLNTRVLYDTVVFNCR
jgi:hypothetical protein